MSLAALVAAALIPWQVSLTLDGYIVDPVTLREGPALAGTLPCTYQGLESAYAPMYCGLARGDVFTASLLADETPLDGPVDEFHLRMNRILIDSAAAGFTATDRDIGLDLACCTDGRTLLLQDSGRWRFLDLYSGGYLSGSYALHAVPEGSTPWLMLIAALGAIWSLWRRREHPA